MLINTPETSIKKERESNLELLRIIAMLAIIAHHYVVNSGVTGKFIYDGTITSQQYFLEVWGMWGKVGINAFILISGYFMCKMTLTLKRYVKLLVQIMFYGLTIMVIFAMCDYHTITIEMLVYTLLSPLMQINRSFVASFMAFYAFVPFYNKFIDFLSQKQFIVLIAGLLFVMTFCSSFFLAPTMNEPIWYMTLYFVAAYIRIYPNKYFYNLKLSSITLVVSIVLAIVACLSFVHMASITGRHVFVLYKWHLVADSNKALAFIIGLSAFLTAKNLNIGHNRIINGLAAGCFGVLLIHASSDTMRKWLWQDVCNVPEMFYSDIISLVVQAIAVPIIVFLVCSFIDHFYKKYLEPAFMGMIFPEKKKSIQMTSNG